MSYTGPGQLPVGASMTPPPAGWYADPYIYNGQRYWDGYQWTSHVAASPDAVAVGSAAAAPGFASFAPTSAVAPNARRDGISIAAFVTAVLGVLPLSLPFGVAGLVRTNASRRSGRRLAVAGLIISAVWIFGLVTAGLVFMIDDGGSADSRSSNPDSSQVILTDLRSGECVDLPSYVPQSQDWLDVVDCAVPHNAEVYEVGDFPDGPYPGDSQVEDAVDQLCDTGLVRFSGSTHSRLDTYEILPTRDTWDTHDRGYVCIAVDDAHDDTGTMANTG